MKKETKLQELERRILALENAEKVKWQNGYKSELGNWNGCPPHNYIQKQYIGTWSASVPPPTMFCTKCGNWI